MILAKKAIPPCFYQNCIRVKLGRLDQHYCTEFSVLLEHFPVSAMVV